MAGVWGGCSRTHMVRKLQGKNAGAQCLPFLLSPRDDAIRVCLRLHLNVLEIPSQTCPEVCSLDGSKAPLIDSPGRPSQAGSRVIFSSLQLHTSLHWWRAP